MTDVLALVTTYCTLTIEDDGTGYISLFLTDTTYQVKKTTSFA